MQLHCRRLRSVQIFPATAFAAFVPHHLQINWQIKRNKTNKKKLSENNIKKSNMKFMFMFDFNKTNCCCSRRFGTSGCDAVRPISRRMEPNMTSRMQFAEEQIKIIIKIMKRMPNTLECLPSGAILLEVLVLIFATNANARVKDKFCNRSFRFQNGCYPFRHQLEMASPIAGTDSSYGTRSSLYALRRPACQRECILFKTQNLFSSLSCRAVLFYDNWLARIATVTHPCIRATQLLLLLLSETSEKNERKRKDGDTRKKM